jgi:hypothetical protein
MNPMVQVQEAMAALVHAMWRPVVTGDIVPGTGDTTPRWGYHGYEYSVALGNRLHDVVGEEAAWQSGPATGSLPGCGRRSR